VKTCIAVLVGGPHDQQRRRLELVHDRIPGRPIRRQVPPPQVTVPGGRYVHHRRIFLGQQRIEKYVWRPDVEPAHVRFEVSGELLASAAGRRIIRDMARRSLEELGPIDRVRWFRIDPERKLPDKMRSEEAVMRAARGDRLVVVGGDINTRIDVVAASG
jgi:hypothetical protein